MHREDPRRAVEHAATDAAFEAALARVPPAQTGVDVPPSDAPAGDPAAVSEELTDDLGFEVTLTFDDAQYLAMIAAELRRLDEHGLLDGLEAIVDDPARFESDLKDRASGLYNTETQELYLAPDELIGETPREREARPGYYATNMNFGSVWHELGHHRIRVENPGMDFEADDHEDYWGQSEIEELGAERRKWTDWFDPETTGPVSRKQARKAAHELIQRKVGEYATFGGMEFVAEVFSGLMAGNEYPERIMGLHAKLSGPVPPESARNPETAFEPMVAPSGGDLPLLDAADADLPGVETSIAAQVGDQPFDRALEDAAVYDDESVEDVLEAWDATHVKEHEDEDFYAVHEPPTTWVAIVGDDYAYAEPFDEWIYDSWTWDGLGEWLDHQVSETFEEDFWRSRTAYHVTNVENAARIVVSGGIRPGNETRGTGNRGVGAAVFLSMMSPVDVYGDVTFEVDVQAMEADGHTPTVEMEPAILEARQREAIAHMFFAEDFFADRPHDVSEDTAIFHDSIPIKYLSVSAPPEVLDAVEAEIRAHADGDDLDAALAWLDRQRGEEAAVAPQRVENWALDHERNVSDIGAMSGIVRRWENTETGDTVSIRYVDDPDAVLNPRYDLLFNGEGVTAYSTLSEAKDSAVQAIRATPSGIESMVVPQAAQGVLYRGASLDRMNADEFLDNTIDGGVHDVWYADMTEAERDATKEGSSASKWRGRDVEDALGEFIVEHDEVPITGGLTDAIGTSINFQSPGPTDPGVMLYLDSEKIPAPIERVEYDASYIDEHPGTLAHVDDLAVGEVFVNGELWGTVGYNKQHDTHPINEWGEQARDKITFNRFTAEKEVVARTSDIDLDGSTLAVASHYHLQRAIGGALRPTLNDLPGYSHHSFREDVTSTEGMSDREVTEALWEEMVAMLQWPAEDYWIVVRDDDRLDRDATRVPREEFRWAYNPEHGFVEDYDAVGLLVGKDRTLAPAETGAVAGQINVIGPENIPPEAMRIARAMKDWGATGIQAHAGVRVTTIDFKPPFPPGDQQPIGSSAVVENGEVTKATLRFGVLDGNHDDYDIERLADTVESVPMPGASIAVDYGDEHWPPRPHVLVGWRSGKADDVLIGGDIRDSVPPGEFIDYAKAVGEAIREEFADEYMDGVEAAISWAVESVEEAQAASNDFGEWPWSLDKDGLKACEVDNQYAFCRAWANEAGVEAAISSAVESAVHAAQSPTEREAVETIEDALHEMDVSPKVTVLNRGTSMDFDLPHSDPFFSSSILVKRGGGLEAEIRLAPLPTDGGSLRAFESGVEDVVADAAVESGTMEHMGGVSVDMGDFGDEYRPHVRFPPEPTINAEEVARFLPALVDEFGNEFGDITVNPAAAPPGHQFDHGYEMQAVEAQVAHRRADRFEEALREAASEWVDRDWKVEAFTNPVGAGSQIALGIRVFPDEADINPTDIHFGTETGKIVDSVLRFPDVPGGPVTLESAEWEERSERIRDAVRSVPAPSGLDVDYGSSIAAGHTGETPHVVVTESEKVSPREFASWFAEVRQALRDEFGMDEGPFDRPGFAHLDTRDPEDRRTFIEKLEVLYAGNALQGAVKRVLGVVAEDHFGMSGDQAFAEITDGTFRLDDTDDLADWLDQFDRDLASNFVLLVRERLRDQYPEVDESEARTTEPQTGGVRYITDHTSDGINPTLREIAESGDFGSIQVKTMPPNGLGPWTAPGVPKAQAPMSPGGQIAEVRMPVEDFRRLQTHIGVDIGWSDSVEDFWDVAQPGDDRVQELVDVLTGEVEPDFGLDGLPMPWVQIGRNGNLMSDQEGRHRLVAAEELGMETIPVRIVYNAEREGKADVEESLRTPGDQPGRMTVRQAISDAVHARVDANWKGARLPERIGVWDLVVTSDGAVRWRWERADGGDVTTSVVRTPEDPDQWRAVVGNPEKLARERLVWRTGDLANALESAVQFMEAHPEGFDPATDEAERVAGAVPQMSRAEIGEFVADLEVSSFANRYRPSDYPTLGAMTDDAWRDARHHVLQLLDEAAHAGEIDGYDFQDANPIAESWADDVRAHLRSEYDRDDFEARVAAAIEADVEAAIGQQINDREFGVIVPKFDNSGRPISPEVFEDIAARISDRFGGVTVYPSIAGCYKPDDGGDLICEENALVTTVRQSSDGVPYEEDAEFLRGLSDEVAEDLGQFSLLVTEDKIEAELVEGTFRETLPEDKIGRDVFQDLL